MCWLASLLLLDRNQHTNYMELMHRFLVPISFMGPNSQKFLTIVYTSMCTTNTEHILRFKNVINQKPISRSACSSKVLLYLLMQTLNLFRPVIIFHQLFLFHMILSDPPGFALEIKLRNKLFWKHFFMTRS